MCVDAQQRGFELHHALPDGFACAGPAGVLQLGAQVTQGHGPDRARRRFELVSDGTDLPGIYVVYPSNPADAKGLLKSAIRTNNPVMFVESQGLYTAKGLVPEGEQLVPIGVAKVVREGGDVTLVSWGPAVVDSLAAAERLAAEDGVAAEVIDLRSLVPLDIETVLASVRKTGRCVVAAQAVLSGSFVNEIVARIQQDVFDYLDAPVARIGALNGISPQAESLEKAFLPNAGDIYAAAKGLL